MNRLKLVRDDLPDVGATSPKRPDEVLKRMWEEADRLKVVRIPLPPVSKRPESGEKARRAQYSKD